MHETLRTNKGFNKLKGIASSIEMPAVSLPEIMVGVGLVGIVAAVGAGMYYGDRKSRNEITLQEYGEGNK